MRDRLAWMRDELFAAPRTAAALALAAIVLAVLPLALNNYVSGLR